MESEVWQLETSYLERWPYIVALMRHYVLHQDCQVEGSKPIEGADQACQLKRIAIFTILDSLCTMIKEKDEEAFHCLYWVLKTFG